MKNRKWEHVFTAIIPDSLEKDKLYVSLDYNTVVHLCACGCGEEVVTPLNPADWKMTYDGEAISLYPSIGNWSYRCRSHYWIRGNQVEWAEAWSDDQVKRARELDNNRRGKNEDISKSEEAHVKGNQRKGNKFFSWLKNLFS